MARRASTELFGSVNVPLIFFERSGRFDIVRPTVLYCWLQISSTRNHVCTYKAYVQSVVNSAIPITLIFPRPCCKGYSSRLSHLFRNALSTDLHYAVCFTGDRHPPRAQQRRKNSLFVVEILHNLLWQSPHWCALCSIFPQNVFFVPTLCKGGVPATCVVCGRMMNVFF